MIWYMVQNILDRYRKEREKERERERERGREKGQHPALMTSAKNKMRVEEIIVKQM